ncbi:bcl-2-related protein A1-like [Rhincodon typus]|uniref:bcl-2-related protein A1-like n=1 Tax=Rhincodon typus TaxID=259920 RepID=UPI0009A39AA9|nr:bcl-2-related protein A1-like [Rhincodon typus]
MDHDSHSKQFVYVLVKDYLKFALDGSQSVPATSSAAETLRKAAALFQRVREHEFELYIKQLKLASIEDVKRAFPILMNEISSDGKDNWGRLVALYAFCGELARHLRRRGIPEEELVEDMAQCMAHHTWTLKAAWIQEKGGWEKGFVDYFKQENPGFVEYFRQKSPRFSYAKLAAVTGIIAAFSFVLYQH